MLITAKWGKEEKHIRKMDKERFLILQEENGSKKCKQNKVKPTKKKKSHGNKDTPITLLRITSHSNFSSSPILSIIACKSKQLSVI
jgi:hypothetical protein